MHQSRIAVCAFAIVACGPLSSPVLADGPFGFVMGSPLTQYGEAEKLKNPGFYKFTTAPRSHPSFDFYMVMHHRETGVCLVRAAGRTIQTNSFGTQIVGEFKSVRDQVASVYGKSGTNDFLRSGSIWKDPGDWMMGLYKTDRVLQAYWDAKSKANLKDGIVEILLDAVALSNDKGYVTLQYRFSNTAKCDELVKQDTAKAF